jgi:hypothetical protein
MDSGDGIDFAKYPHFKEKFLYKPFKSGLTNIRVNYNKEQTTREAYVASGSGIRVSHPSALDCFS